MATVKTWNGARTYYTGMENIRPEDVLIHPDDLCTSIEDQRIKKNFGFRRCASYLKAKYGVRYDTDLSYQQSCEFLAYLQSLPNLEDC